MFCFQGGVTISIDLLPNGFGLVLVVLVVPVGFPDPELDAVFSGGTRLKKPMSTITLRKRLLGGSAVTERHIITPMSTPTYIYKIVPSSTPPPNPLPERLPVSELDNADGFLHLSTAVQIPRTLTRFFANTDKVYILRIEYKNLEKDIKWELISGGK